jgi:hypothetical protein
MFRASRFRRVVPLLLLVAVVAVGAGASRPVAASTARASAGTLTFHADLDSLYPVATCPSGYPDSVECFTRTATGLVAGLGAVEVTFPYFVDDAAAGCDVNEVKVLPTTAQLRVSGKGEITARLPGAGCHARSGGPFRTEQPFTITGGSGMYAGAAGSGTLSDVSSGPPELKGKDTWAGTLVVPGASFDVTPPTFSGAASKVVSAPKHVKKMRVSFKVTAHDDVDGSVQVACVPPSGSRFKVGKTRVSCTATDSSGNTATTQFVVTVKSRG